MSTDEYRRGRAVERERAKQRADISGQYRGILPTLYVIGLVLFAVVSLFLGPESAFMVVFVTHLFYAGLIRADIKSLRRQGVTWGASRHLWFGAAFALPFVAPIYYLYSGRVIRREKEARTPSTDEGVSTDSGSTDATDSEATDATDSEATDATDSEATDATDSEATDATDSEATDATDSEATDATDSEATDGDTTNTDDDATDANTN